MRRLVCWKSCATHLLAVALVISAATPAWACDYRTENAFDWQRCWSVSRLLIAGLLLVPCWVVWFEVIFRQRLHYRNLDAPSPRNVFAFCLAWCWVTFWAMFLVLFALLSDELREPGTYPLFGGWLGSALNSHYPWLLAVLAIVVSALGINWLFKSRDTAPRREAS